MLVVKEDLLNEAKNVFSDLNVEITLGGRFLGGVIGDSTEAQQYVADKVTRWVQAVERLSIGAKNFPQSAYSAFTHSLVNEWTYLQWIFESGEIEYIPLRNSIQEIFSAAILGRVVLEADHDLLALLERKEASLSPILSKRPKPHSTHQSQQRRCSKRQLRQEKNLMWLLI